MFHLTPPPSFRGLRDDVPLTVYERHMPHWRQDAATYFVTFRLGDSLPRERLLELADRKREWEEANPPPRSPEKLEELTKMVFERVEHWLDQGAGSCVLKDPTTAEILHSAMQHFEVERYELACSVVMPNHAHVVVRPMTHRLEEILKSWKGFTARKINRALNQQGDLWQQESYDRIVRDSEHLWKCIQYIGKNPKKANLSPASCHRWINPKWEELGWAFV